MASSVGDLLSAASLLLAGAGVVYGVWYPEVAATLEQPIPQHAADRRPVQKRLTAALWRRALPLATFSLATTTILMPDAVRLIVASARAHGSGRVGAYDAVATLYVAIVVFAALFTTHLVALAWRIGSRLRSAR